MLLNSPVTIDFVEFAWVIEVVNGKRGGSGGRSRKREKVEWNERREGSK
jgi:hypothetical protein